jgi:hypothetical protein
MHHEAAVTKLFKDSHIYRAHKTFRRIRKPRFACRSRRNNSNGRELAMAPEGDHDRNLTRSSRPNVHSSHRRRRVHFLGYRKAKRPFNYAELPGSIINRLLKSICVKRTNDCTRGQEPHRNGHCQSKQKVRPSRGASLWSPDGDCGSAGPVSVDQL